MGVAFAALLLTPVRPDTVLAVLARRVPLPGPLASVSRGDLWWALEDIANVLLFVPLGFALTRVLGRGLYGATAGLLVSAAIETAQLVVPDRHSSLLDVICNSVGAVIGALLATAVWRQSESQSETRGAQTTSLSHIPGAADLRHGKKSIGSR